MTEAFVPVIVAAAAVLIAALVCGAALSAWRGWIELKRAELDRTNPAPEPYGGTATGRIELADLKERLRKLEAIAAGVDD